MKKIMVSSIIMSLIFTSACGVNNRSAQPDHDAQPNNQAQTQGTGNQDTRNLTNSNAQSVNNQDQRTLTHPETTSHAASRCSKSRAVDDDQRIQFNILEINVYSGVTQKVALRPYVVTLSV